MTGTAGQKRVPANYFAYSPFPLPPVTEQHRIVTRVNELMTLCDQLESAQAERETRRDRLTAASLNRLNHPESADIATLRDHARFHLTHLAQMTSRRDQIQQLRQTILNLAVRGQLVSQDQDDEPVRIVLTKLRSAKPELPTRRGVPDTVNMTKLVEGWRLPASWECVSAAELLKLGVIVDLKDGNHGANHPKTSEFTEEGLPFITAAQVRGQTLDFEGAYKITGVPLKRLRVGFAKAGDVIFTHKGSVGRVGITPGDCVLSPQTTYYRLNPSVLSNRYLMWFISSPAFSEQVDEVKKQTTRNFVSITKQYEFFHAIPPLAEQRRIVTKVEELMSLCDRLEAEITTTETESGRLLEAVLHQVLSIPA